MKERCLFKAKRTDNGEWVQGALFFRDNGSAVICNQNPADDSFQVFEVDPSTSCQCTTSQDKNGNLIWENDIARDKYGNFYKAFWRNNHNQFSWICVKSDVFPTGTKWDLWSFKISEVEVIGNIFDNPTLLEE